MPKILKATFPEKCIGCELCVIEAQRQLKKAGLESSLIRIFKEKDTDTSKLTFSVQLDPAINKYSPEKIKDICPTAVFEVEESKDSQEYELVS